MTMLLAALSVALVAGQAKEKSDASYAETRAMVHQYGTCLLKTQQKRASAAILANLDNAELMKRYPQLIDGACMPTAIGQVVRVSFAGDQFRYALADALIRKEFSGQTAPDLEVVGRLDHRVPTPPSRLNAKGKPLSDRAYQRALDAYLRMEAFSYLSRYGECVVRVDPASAHSLLVTLPESAEEEAQFAAMSKALSTCVQEGSTLKFNKMSLRGTVAVNYYRLAVAARQQSAAGGAR
jgi:hypothetical protein